MQYPIVAASKPYIPTSAGSRYFASTKINVNLHAKVNPLRNRFAIFLSGSFICLVFDV